MSRLDAELVSRNLVRSRTLAAEFIKDNKVSVDGKVVSKTSFSVNQDSVIEVAGDAAPDYVSRAGHKLAGALEYFPEVTVAGKRCFDAGASTGGFTDVLLRNGASQVVAVDVGHGQLVDSLRNDPRVDVYEGLNIRYMEAEVIGGPSALTVCDVSFISLTKIMGPLALATDPGGDLLLMIKPQFEVGKDRLARTGVVSSENERRRAVEIVGTSALANGLELKGLGISPLAGQEGNVEYFLWARREVSARPHKIEEDSLAVSALLETLWPAESLS